MCHQVQCPRCKKPTYAGCGAHVEAVLGHIPKADRCQCRDERSDTPPRDPPSRFRWPF